MADQIEVERAGPGWALKHNGGFLGFTRTHDEAAMIAADLAAWILGQGRTATVILAEPRTFSDHHA